MKRMGKLPWLLSILLLLMIPITSPQADPRPEDRGEEETILVGRISHVEGQLFRYVPDEGDWVATVKDAPFGIDDALYSDKDGRAEIIMPNNTWVWYPGRVAWIHFGVYVGWVPLAEGKGARHEIDCRSVREDRSTLCFAVNRKRLGKVNKNRYWVFKVVTTFSGMLVFWSL